MAGPSSASAPVTRHPGRGIPATALWVFGLHLAWGLFAWLGYPHLGAAATAAQPLLVATWFGTSMMLMIFGLVVASGGWRIREARYLAVLLVFDFGPIIVAVEQVRLG